MLLNHLSNVNMAFVEARPNIRIEIQNNLMEPMDIDGENKAASDFEDGEISDKNETAEENPFTTKVATNNRVLLRVFTLKQVLKKLNYRCGAMQTVVLLQV